MTFEVQEMNKTLWMCWFQGEEDASLHGLNKKCIERWREFNPDWEVNVLDNQGIREIIPEYFEIIGDNKVLLATCSEVVRILLLRKFGGVWADASVYPMDPLDAFIPEILNDVGFFTYRFIPRALSKRRGDRETVSWFLVADRSEHPLIVKWADAYLSRFKDWPDEPKYFQFHEDLASLYDTDEQVKHTIDNMVQISEKIPHSARYFGWERREPSFMYKRPKKIPDEFLKQK